MAAYRLIVLASLAIAVPRLAAADALAVTSPVAVAAAICDTCPNPIVLPLTIKGADPKNVRVHVIDVTFASEHDPAWREVVVPAITTTSGTELTLTVTPGALRKTGTYQVQLEFTAEGQPAVPLTVQMTRPAAALQAPGTIVVERVVGNPLSPTAAQSVTPFVLRETSGRSSLSVVNVLPPIPTPESVIHAAGEQTACPDDKRELKTGLAAGETRCFQYSLVGPFPLGTHTQTHTIAAPELAAPVSVTFDIRSRRSRLYLGLYAFLGLLVSLFVKIFLQRRIELGDARLLAAELVDNVEADIREHQDETFVGAVTKGLTTLRDAMRGSDAAAIATARTALAATWQTERDALARRHQAVQEKVNALRTVVETPWLVPAALAKAIAAGRATVATAREDLAHDRVAKVDRDTESLRQTLVNNAGTAITQWQTDVPIVLAALVATPVGISPDVAAAGQQGLTATTVGTTQLSAAATADALQLALDSMTQERRSVRKPVLSMGALMEAEIDRALSQLNLLRTGAPDLVRAVAAGRQRLLDVVDDPQQQNEALASLQAMDAAWRSTLTTNSGGTLSAAAQTALAGRRYVDAATAIAQSLAAGAQNDSGSRRADPPIFAGDDTHVSVAVFSTAGPREQRPPTLRGFRARTSAEIAAAKMWQTLVTALLAGLIGYGLFAPKFIGDYQDFLVIFFWAFGLDLTVDAVSKLAPTARR